MLKVCRVCKQELDNLMFSKNKRSADGLDYTCKNCVSEYQKEYRLKKREEIKKRWRDYYYLNGGKEKQAEYYKKYRKDNFDKKADYLKKYAEKHKQELKDYYKEYRKVNSEKLKAKKKEYYEKIKANGQLAEYRQKNRKQIAKRHNEYLLNLYHNDAIARLKNQIRGEIRRSFNSKGFTKKLHTEEILKCDYETFILHLMKTYEDKYGEEYIGQPVHIDHIIPLQTATTEEEVYKLCHYKNLCLLKPKDNLEKGSKMKGSD